MRIIVVVFCFLAFAYGKGTDMSSVVSKSDFECLSNDGFGGFAVPRAWHSNGYFDSNACTTTKNAHNAGVTPHVYLFPCPLCGHCKDQVRWTVKNLTHCDAPFNMVWLDIESPDNWHSNKTKNQDCFSHMVEECNDLGVKCGVYASEYEWTTIMGSKNEGGKKYELWYPDYDGVANCKSFVPFGGWTSAKWKQYQGTTSKCGASVDLSVGCSN